MKKIVYFLKYRKVKTIYFSITILVLMFAFIFSCYELIYLPIFLYLFSILYDFICFVLSKDVPLLINTPDGYNEPFHPSVLYFEDGWNGYRYWMAYTPFPIKGIDRPYRDRWECPCVYSSNDGIHFDTPRKSGGAERFVDDLSDKEIKNQDYFSDPHLVYNESNDTIELYYRLTNRCKGAPNNEVLNLFKKTSSNGWQWTERETLLRSDRNPDIGLVYISPAIIRKHKVYLMWFVSSYESNRTISFAKSYDMHSFFEIEKCELIGRYCDPWHIDCFEEDNIYYLLVYEFSDEISIWKSADGILFYYEKVVIRHSSKPGCFYHGLYRSCLSKNHFGGYSMYFSSRNRYEVGLGVAIGNSIERMSVVSGNAKKNLSLFFVDIMDKYFFLLAKISRKIFKK